jgi:glycosyltransferase involved in cell wall biosynthesis
MRFEARAASSIELCVSEWTSGSRFRDQTMVTAERSDQPPLLDIGIVRLSPMRRLSSWHLAWSIRQHRRRHPLNLIVTQQHVVTAGRIARLNPAIPVVLQTHNFIDPPRSGSGAKWHNQAQIAALNRLGGITLVSDATLAKFEADWPQVTIPRAVITNGFDFSTWAPATQREKVILVVGRNEPAKGIWEAAQACALFLSDHPDWRAAFILSEGSATSGYPDRVKAALAPVASQVDQRSGIPFSTVKALTEKAAICIVASRWVEPFGRTALEAHAGGAALISSGTGGLSQISGDCALMLDAISGPAIACALTILEADPRYREDLARRGADRVRRLFPLTSGAGEVAGAVPVCERLDSFFDRVVTQWKRHGD